jgi:hypothetical protein
MAKYQVTIIGDIDLFRGSSPMPTNFEALRQMMYFEDAGAEEQRLATGVAAAIELLSAASRFPIPCPPGAIDERHIINAVEVATGRLVRKVMYVEALQPHRARAPRPRRSWSKPPPLPAKAAADEHDINFSLAEALRSNLAQPFSFCLDNTQIRSVGTALWKGLWADMRPRLLTAHSRIVSALVRDSLWVTLLYLIGFAHGRNRKRVRQLLPLIDLLPWAVPLGESAKEPGTWYVLVPKNG